MKRIIILILCLTCLSAMAQQFNTRLIPTPHRVEKGEGSYDPGTPFVSVTYPNNDDKAVAKCLKKGGWIYREERVDSIPGAKHQEQAYQIAVTEHEAVLRFVGEQGLQYARLSFQMLNDMWEGAMPCMTITDWPDYEYRGWMDDLSRGPVTNAGFRALQREWGENCKYNFYTLYTEHIQYNPACPEVAPLSVERVDHSLMANLQCFAHFEKTLDIPFYEDIKDTRFNLNPSKEGSYEFLSKQIANVMQYYPEARFFNINCDETESLGSGRARDYVSSLGADEAYVRHINRVYDLLKPYGKEVLMWGDIVGKNPQMLERLPKEMQYIMWSYVPSDSFDEMIAPFKALRERQGNPFWVAGGVSHWSSIMPSQHNYLKNLANLSRDGHKAGARGFMNTAWDDYGESLFADAWHAIGWGAEVSWNTAGCDTKEREQQYNENYDRLMRVYFNCPVEHLSSLLYEVGDLAHNAMVGDWYQTASLWEPLMEFYPSKVDDAMLIRCDSVERLVADILQRYGLPALGTTSLQWENHEMLTSLPHAIYALHRLQVTAQKCRLRAMLYRGKDYKPLMEAYFKSLHLLEQEYLRLWDFESTDYSRNIILERYNRAGREVQEAERRILVSTTAKEGKTYVALRNLGGTPIYYTLDGRKPSTASMIYTEPFVLERSCEVKAVAYNEWGESVETCKYLLLHKGMGHLKQLNSEYSTYRDTYSAGGDNALLDGEMGSDATYNDGHWQGYWGKDIDVELDFGVKTAVSHISMRFMQNSIDWILAPKEIEVYTSANGKDWALVRTAHFDPDFREHGNIIRNDAIRDLNLQTRYLRVVAKNPGLLPSFTPGAGYDSYLFCDELVVE